LFLSRAPPTLTAKARRTFNSVVATQRFPSRGSPHRPNGSRRTISKALSQATGIRQVPKSYSALRAHARNAVTTLYYHQIAKDRSQVANAEQLTVASRRLPPRCRTPTMRSANQRVAGEHGIIGRAPPSVKRPQPLRGTFFVGGLRRQSRSAAMETTGIEPATSGLQSRRSPS
jgi:hypothetical protein